MITADNPRDLAGHARGGVLDDDTVTRKGAMPLRLFIFARHAESAANAEHVLSTNPSQPVALTEQGRVQARALAVQLANVPIDLAVCSRLLRTRETADIALSGRPVPVVIEPGFDEIQAGDLDGKPIQAYWDWLGQHTASDRFPHGESFDDALRRYAGALRWLLGRAGPVTLVITHELALRHIAAAASPEHPPQAGTDFANAVPYLFDEQAVRRAAAALAIPKDPPATVIAGSQLIPPDTKINITTVGGTNGPLGRR